MEGIEIIFDPEKTKSCGGRNVHFTLGYKHFKYGFRMHYRDDTPRKNSSHKKWVAEEVYLDHLPLTDYGSMSNPHRSDPVNIVTDAMLWMERNKDWVLYQLDKHLH